MFLFNILLNIFSLIQRLVISYAHNPPSWAFFSFSNSNRLFYCNKASITEIYRESSWNCSSNDHIVTITVSWWYFCRNDNKKLTWVGFICVFIFFSFSHVAKNHKSLSDHLCGFYTLCVWECTVLLMSVSIMCSWLQELMSRFLREQIKLIGMVQWLALSPHSKKVLGSNLGLVFLWGVCMFSLCLCGLCLGTLASSHIPKTCKLGDRVIGHSITYHETCDSPASPGEGAPHITICMCSELPFPGEANNVHNNQ